MSENQDGIVQPAEASGEIQSSPAQPVPDGQAPVEPISEGSLHEYRLSGPGEVVTKEQNNTSRQISYLSRLLSQRHSLGKSRKYPILGTHREKAVKQNITQITGEARFQTQASVLQNVPLGGPNTDIYSAFASRDLSAGTLQPNSPAAFMEPKHTSMAGALGASGNAKYLAAHRRGGSLSKAAYPHLPRQQLAYPGQNHPVTNVSTGSHQQEQLRGLVHRGSLPNVGQFVMNPEQVTLPLPAQPFGQPLETESFMQLQPAEGYDPAQQIQRLRERSMAALHHLSMADSQASPAQMSALAPEPMSGQVAGAQQSFILNNNAHFAGGADAGAGATGAVAGAKGATSMGLNSAKAMGLGRRHQSVGESTFETPMVTHTGQVKYAGETSLREIFDQDYTELYSQPGTQRLGPGVTSRNGMDGARLNPRGLQDYQQSQRLDNQARNPEGQAFKGAQRTQSLLDGERAGSQQVLPDTAQQYHEQLESWTARSSVVGEAKQALRAQNSHLGTLQGPGLVELANTGFSQNPFAAKDFSQPAYIVQEHSPMPSSSAIASPYYSHSRMDLQSQSMLLQNKGHQIASAAMRVRLEKQEIDKLLKKVRERKRVSLVRDPNIRLDQSNGGPMPRRWSLLQQTPSQKRFAENQQFVMENPIVVTGIRRKSDLLAAPLKVPRQKLGQPFEQIDQTLYARDAQLSRTLDAADTSQKIKIQDRLTKQESAPAMDPTSQRVISTESLAPEAVFLHHSSAKKAHESTQKIVEVTADRPSADDGQSESIKFHFGTQNKDALKNAPGLAIDQKRKKWHANQNEASSTAAGQSVQVIEHSSSGLVLDTDFNQPSAVQLQSSQIEALIGGRSDLELNQQMSKQSFLLERQTGPKKKRMSLPRIKQVFVSPNLRVGGLSVRQRSILQSQKQLASLKSSRVQAQIQSDRFLAGERGQSLRQFPPHHLQQLPEESMEEHFSQSNADLHNMQSLNSIQQVAFPEPLSGGLSSDINKDTGYTQAGSLASLAPVRSRPSDNFFVAIEQLPHLPLKVKLQAKDLMRNLERQIRLKQAAIEKQKKENEEARQVYDHLNDTKKKLKKAAKDIVVYQKQQEKEADKQRKAAVAQDPDLDQKAQLEREMEELERQIQENDERIADRQVHLAQETPDQQMLGLGPEGQQTDVQGDPTNGSVQQQMEMAEGRDQEQYAATLAQPSEDQDPNQVPGDANDAPPLPDLQPGQQTQTQNDATAAMPELPPQQDQAALQQHENEAQAQTQQPVALAVSKPPTLQKIVTAEPSPTKDAEILEAPEEEQAEEGPPLVELDDFPLPGMGDSPFPRIADDEQSPGLLQEALIDRAAEKARLRPQKTVEELQLQAHYAEIESRIYKLYRDYTQNDLKREKKNTLVALRKVKMDGQGVQAELQALQERNHHLKKTIRRYKSLVENFDGEHERLLKFLVEKREETTARRKKEEFMHIKKKINRQHLSGVDAGGTVSPQAGLSRAPDSIKGAEYLSHREQNAVAASAGSRDSAEANEVARGGTIPKAGLKGVRPAGTLLAADLSASERPDATTVSLGSISARGDQEKIRVQALDKLLHGFKQAQRSERPLDVALSVLDLVKASFGCSKVSLFVVDFYTADLLSANVSREKRNYLRQVAYVDESDSAQRQLTAVSRSPEELCDKVLFKSLKDLRSDVRLSAGGTEFAVMIRQSTTGRAVKASSQEKAAGSDPTKQPETLSPPEIANKHQPAFILQGEIASVDRNEAPKRGTQRQPAESKQPPMKLNYTTLMSLQLFCMNIQLKFERLRLAHSLRGQGQSSEVDELIQMIGRIYKRSNLKTLMSGLFTEIAAFFNFKDVSIMFHDEEKDQLYTITYGDQEDKEMEMLMKRAKAASAEELAVLDALEAMSDLTLPANQLIYFPISVGISSMVFQRQRAMYFNNFNRLNNIYFVNEIDNVKSLDKIDNLLITHTTRDDGTSNGLIQLYNHPMPITETLRKKLTAISRFFGACIQNIEDKTKKITASLAVQLEPGESELWLKPSMDAVEESARQYAALLKPIEDIDRTLAKNEVENEQIISGTIPEKRIRELLEGD